MKKVFTPKKNRKKREEVVAPSEKTLDFIRQFAGAYYVEKSLPEAVNEFCVN